jgi:hypothetical protein
VDWEAYLDAVAPAIGLPVDPDWRDGICHFLGLAGEMAATLDAVDLVDDRLDLDAVLVLPEVAR